MLQYLYIMSICSFIFAIFLFKLQTGNVQIYIVNFEKHLEVRLQMYKISESYLQTFTEM